jgi:dTDP-4-amino-4,6-dideoxygalactose transaminase
LLDRNYIVFGQPLIEEAEIREVVACLESAWLGTGPKVAEFEKRIAAYKGVKHAIAVNSCTAGLHLSCLSLGVSSGDEVIVPSMTFCATVNAVIHAGGTPVPVDVDPRTFNMRVEDVRKAITPRTKAIIPVHFAGRAVDMTALSALAQEFGLKVIEDCAHAIETEHRGQKVGTIGDCGVLSFYSTKNIVTGEGGMVLTNDDQIANRLKTLALHGMSTDAWRRFSDQGYKHYDVVEVGFKYNMMDLQAAIGMHQITRVDQYWLRRKAIWEAYCEAFADLPVTLPAALEPENRHAFHLFTLLIEPGAGITRDEFLMAMHERKIGTGVHYRSIPTFTVYREKFGWDPALFPHSQSIGDRTVSLPISAKLTDEDVNYIIEQTRSILGGRDDAKAKPSRLSEAADAKLPTA